MRARDSRRHCAAPRALGANLGVRPLGGAFQGLRLSEPAEFVDPQRPEYPAGLDFASRKSAASNPHRALCCCLVLPHSPPRDRVNTPFPSPQIFLSAASLLAYSRLPYDFLPPSLLPPLGVALPTPVVCTYWRRLLCSEQRRAVCRPSAS